MGGSDEPSNLIELSIEEHALAHKKLYEEYGKLEDKIAWLSLSAHIDKDEIFFQTSSLGGRNNQGKLKLEEHKKRISNTLFGTKLSTERKKSISRSMMNNTNSKNHSSEEYKKTQSDAMKKAWAKRKQINK